ncbi:MAG: F0F1 ATP synthase subunit A [Bacteroidia bacterium]|nr:F0F1 ATP synthase subunit A [Bacteroidia bacterium]
MLSKNIIALIAGMILFLVFHTSVYSGTEEEVAAPDSAAAKSEEGKFKPGPFIMEHIQDAHEWHIAQFGHTHITIPLPVILISRSEKNKGLHIFMSSKFHHGESVYNGFKIEREGKLKGKIVEVTSDGKVDEAAPLPIDISITKNVLALFISVILILWIFISVANTYKKRVGKAPKGLQSWIEPLIIFVRDDIAKPSIGEHRYEKYLPFLLSVFFFIFINNLLGLVPIFPGGANLTGNIAVTMTLALFTFFITTFSTNKGYWIHIVNAPGVPWWLKIPLPLMPVVELIGVITKPFVLMIRLFANITAGHIIVLGFFCLIFIFGAMSIWAGYGFSVLSVSFTVFMGLLELLVAFIQAYVFTLLSALYFGMAQVEEHHH